MPFKLIKFVKFVIIVLYFVVENEPFEAARE